MIENPGGRLQPQVDIVSEVLRSVRVTGSLQFCLHSGASWRTDPADHMPSHLLPHAQLMCFHILVQGACWLRSELGTRDLLPGDIVAFPFGGNHDLGTGNGQQVVTPLGDLPPSPWSQTPVISYATDTPATRLICGFLHCEALNFPPMRRCLPPIVHVRTDNLPEGHWLRAAILQLATEMEQPKSGGVSVVERLTEAMLVELLRYQLLQAEAKPVGWLTALSEPSLCRCISAIHQEPMKQWSLADLARVARLSRSVLAERFRAVLGVSPMRYVRDWRLYLASIALKSGNRSIATIAEESGYGTEAAFTRAFAKSFGLPPAAWRKSDRT